jgi:ribonuclease HI
MEIRAAVEALKAVPATASVLLYTDSEYLCQGIERLLAEGANWLTRGREVKNHDLWRELGDELQRHPIECRWLRSHVGHPWNERADALACAAIPAEILPLDDDKAIHIFIASSCQSAGMGPGGWGALLRYHLARKILSGREGQTSSNRMHLLAALRGLEAVKKPLPIHLYTTSEYFRDGITRWVSGWRDRNWRTREGRPVLHRDLWEAILEKAAAYTVRYHLVREPALPAEMVEVKQAALKAARASAGGVSPQGAQVV